MIDHKDKPGWMIGLRRRPAGLSVNHQDDGTGMFEIICRMCGGDPALDYRQVSAELRQIRGCYSLRAGIVPFFKHQAFHDRADRRSDARSPRSGRQVAERPSQGCTLGKTVTVMHPGAVDWPGSSSPSRSRSEEPPAAVLVSVASLLEELVRLQQETVELLREMAHTEGSAAIPWLSKAREPVRPLASVPAPAGPDEGEPGQATGPGRPTWLEEPLTQREEAVLRRLTTTLSLREIGRALDVSRNTVKSHTRAIYRKLGVSNRHEAVQRARELALLARRPEADTPTPRAG